MFKWLRQKDPTESNTEHVHNFGKWEVDREVKVFEKEGDTLPYGTRIVQLRECKICGFTERNRSEVM